MASTNQDRIQLHELSFSPFLTEQDIKKRVKELGQELTLRLGNGNPSFLIMLRGAFIFARRPDPCLPPQWRS